jgi:ornithine carbamoyltransferase
MAVVQLGGHPIVVKADEVSLDVRESVEDVTRTFACYHAAIGARVFEHAKLERMVSVSPVPIVNLLSDDAHPLQAVADLLTIEDTLGDLEGRTVAYIGDPNNVFRSLALACVMAGVHVRFAGPASHPAQEADLDRIAAAGEPVTVCARPEEAVEGADVVYADVWYSMGQEGEAEERRRQFEGYTIDDALLDRALPHAVLLHCLPAHRGDEVTAEVVDGPRSQVWPQATNRMHAARGALSWLLAGEG